MSTFMLWSGWCEVTVKSSISWPFPGISAWNWLCVWWLGCWWKLESWSTDNDSFGIRRPLQTLALGAMQLQSDQHVNALALVGMFDVVAFLEVSIPIWEDHPGSWLQSEASLLYFFLSLWFFIYTYYIIYIYIYIYVCMYVYTHICTVTALCGQFVPWQIAG